MIAPKSLDNAPKALRFLILAVKKARDDRLSQQAAALAFMSMLALVPLLAVVSYVGARAFFPEGASSENLISEDERLISLLSQILPFSESSILTALRIFLDQAQTLGSFGFAMFVLTSFNGFFLVEETLNHIWNASDRRPWRHRIWSFTLVLFWGPLLTGAAYSGLFFLRQRGLLETVYAQLLELVPALFTFFGLTLLYWLVPAKSVRLRSAFLGSAVATALLLGLRYGFGLYVHHFPSMSLIYGSFGLALLFMISLQCLWWIILLGSEVTYAVQHVTLLTQRRSPAEPLSGRWLGLAVMLLLAERLQQGQPVTPQDLLAERLRVEPDGLPKALSPLVDAGLVQQVAETEDSQDSYLLSCDPHALEVARIFALYDSLHAPLIEPPAATPRWPRLAELYHAVSAGRKNAVAGWTLAEVLRSTAEGDLVSPQPANDGG